MSGFWMDRVLDLENTFDEIRRIGWLTEKTFVL